MGKNIVLKILAIVLVLATFCMGVLVIRIYYGNMRLARAQEEQKKEREEEEKREAINQKNEKKNVTEKTIEKEKEEALEESYSKQDLCFVQKKYDKYTYSKMVKDIDILSKLYEDKISVSVLTTTADSRNVYDISVGNLESDNQYIVTGSIHAREYITTKLVMMLMVDLLDLMDEDSDFLIHFVPMINPDGVSISQMGKKGIKNDFILSQVEQIAQNDGSSIEDREYLRQWKANANGVDLNRNFDAKWDEFEGNSYPSSERYKGSFPGSENEAAALISLTQNYPIKRTISYHTKGNVIYWYFAQTGELLEETESFATRISNCTGYRMDADFESLDPAGYKDWAICQMKIPSITIEVGTGENPVSEHQIDEIYERNKEVLNILLEN